MPVSGFQIRLLTRLEEINEIDPFSSVVATAKMSFLIFHYGTMSSSKTATLLMTAHTLRSQGKRVCTVKSAIDTRIGIKTISSRVGLSEEADVIVVDSDIQIKGSPDIILVDEAQFLSPIVVEKLRNLATTTRTPVICYGLLTDYRTRLFPGSKRLIELADQIKEISYSVGSLGDCSSCKRNNAIVNAKFTTSELSNELNIVRGGSTAPDLGAEEKYITLCWECWRPVVE